MAQNKGYPQKNRFGACDTNAIDVVRRVFWERIRIDNSFNQLQPQDTAFSHYVEFAQPRDQEDFHRMVVDIFWELVMQGVISPGTSKGNPSPPFFHLTDYGKRVLEDPDYDPHDAEQYLQQLGVSLSNPDLTVLAYLREALHCFSRSTMVASAMMLGIAAERVFLLVCEALLDSLADAKEKAKFKKILSRNAMKPKLDWLSNKFQQIQNPTRPKDWPEITDIQITGIYNLIRCQRNDVGHPRPEPPSVTRDAAYVYLRIFPNY